MNLGEKKSLLSQETQKQLTKKTNSRQTKMTEKAMQTPAVM